MSASLSFICSLRTFTRLSQSKSSNQIISITKDTVCAKSLQLCLTLCNPMDHSPPGPCVHGILQAKILEWIAMPFSKGSS